MARRLTKKELKQPDQFQSFSQRVFDLAGENLKMVCFSAGIVLALVIAVLGWYFYQGRYESKAAHLYAEAYGSYESLLETVSERSRLEAAVEGYEKLLREYPASNAALTASYNLGNLYYSLEAYDNSISAYGRYLEKAPRGSVLRPLSWYGLGYAMEARGDYPGALESFQKAHEGSSGIHFKAINYSNMARMYEKMSDREKALQYYEKVIDVDSDVILAGLARNRIAEIR
ncbi:MAG: tetratricopeptide repeat protein [Syntrophales bacterium]|nr:tetratricopeptide repeat protein [Syntrophales bacterium]MCK9527249.1 tetratricopeptide repeat protein [Syntrophales bacterium]MDX9921281.1 tetratricopeptide repeat protein [Syntrophales bacterium]